MATAAVQLSKVNEIYNPCRPLMTALFFVLGDIISIVVAWVLAISARLCFGGVLDLTWYLRLSPVLLALVAAFGVSKLYPGSGISPIEELRLFVRATSAVYMNLIILTFLMKRSENYSRVIFVVAWMLTICLLPLVRKLVRRTAGSMSWWGSPAILLGSGRNAVAFLNLLKSDPGLGLRVQAIVTETNSREHFDEIPVVRGFHNLQSVSKSSGITHALVAMSSESALPISEIVRVYGRYFPKLSIIPDLLGPANLCLEARAVGNILTLGVRQNLLLTGPKIYKRTIDVLAALIIGILLSPMLLIIALAIKLSSRGPILYGQRRVGKDGINFCALKFRTMIVNADEILHLHLQSDEALRSEWERDHKLKNDPRTTLLGKFLRQYSLDELPQIWNVIVGEMSMIGPRPIVKDEIRRYGDNYDVYSRVLPGITGLWQVSGRNDTTYRERIELDCYYVYNWSPWLDLHILTRTFSAVMGRRGAY